MSEKEKKNQNEEIVPKRDSVSPQSVGTLAPTIHLTPGYAVEGSVPDAVYKAMDQDEQIELVKMMLMALDAEDDAEGDRHAVALFDYENLMREKYQSYIPKG